METYVGLDVSQKSTAVCIVEQCRHHACYADHRMAIGQRLDMHIDHCPRSVARELGPGPLTAAARSPKSNGMVESFVKTMEHNYVAYMDKFDVPT